MKPKMLLLASNPLPKPKYILLERREHRGQALVHGLRRCASRRDIELAVSTATGGAQLVRLLLELLHMPHDLGYPYGRPSTALASGEHREWRTIAWFRKEFKLLRTAEETPFRVLRDPQHGHLSGVLVALARGLTERYVTWRKAVAGAR